jgi:hypothetical protein
MSFWLIADLRSRVNELRLFSVGYNYNFGWCVELETRLLSIISRKQGQFVVPEEKQICKGPARNGLPMRIVSQ